MTKSKTNKPYSGKRFFNTECGFSLIELMIVLSLIGVILSVAFNFFVFGVNSFDIGEKQSDIQQNARLAASFITKELRIAERVIIVEEFAFDHDGFVDLEEMDQSGLVDLEELSILTENDFDLYFIYIQDGEMYYQKIEYTHIENSTHEISGEELRAIPGVISEKIDFELVFKIGESQDNLLQFSLSAIEKESGRTFNLDTEVLVLNINKVEIQSSEEGSAIIYQIPAPPEPTIRNINIDPEILFFGETEIEVTMMTNNVSFGEKVLPEVWKIGLDEDDIFINGIKLLNLSRIPEFPTVDDNTSVFIIQMPADLEVGTYYVLVDLDSVSFSQRRLFYIEPSIIINVTTLGQVEIIIKGIKEVESISLVLILINIDDSEEILESSFIIPAIPDDSGIFGFMISDELPVLYEELLDKSLVLEVTINGKFTARSDSFMLKTE